MATINDGPRMRGRMQVFKNGKLVRDVRKQLIVSAGQNWAAARLKDAGIPAAMSHIGIGTTGGKAFTADAVTNQLTSAGHGFTTGQYTEVWQTPGLTLAGGLSAETVYFVRAVDANTVTLHMTAADAASGANPADITAANNGGYFMASSADTALGAQLARVALASTTVLNNVVTYEATFAPGSGTGVLKEAGLFNDPAAGTMLARATFGDVTKGDTDEITVRWTVTMKAG